MHYVEPFLRRSRYAQVLSLHERRVTWLQVRARGVHSDNITRICAWSCQNI